MIDLDKLSYETYGNLVLITLTLIAVLFNLFPFDLFGLITCIIQIPLYLLVRGNLKEPIHAEGLNICFILTLLFYILLFLVLKLTNMVIGEEFALFIASITNIISCYFTSTACNGKTFFGYKKHNESKYNKLLDYIKYNGLNEELLESERKLKDIDTQMYLIYKRKFREDKTYKEINEEFNLENARITEILDKVYFYMIGALRI